MKMYFYIEDSTDMLSSNISEYVPNIDDKITFSNCNQTYTIVDRIFVTEKSPGMLYPRLHCNLTVKLIE